MALQSLFVFRPGAVKTKKQFVVFFLNNLGLYHKTDWKKKELGVSFSLLHCKLYSEKGKYGTYTDFLNYDARYIFRSVDLCVVQWCCHLSYLTKIAT